MSCPVMLCYISGIYLYGFISSDIQNYQKVANIIDDLAIELGEEDNVAEVDMIAFTDSPTELQAPHINFFAESGAAEVESNFQVIMRY